MTGAGRRPRLALVVNPVSGGGRAGRLAPAVARRLRAGADVTVAEGRSADESRALVAAGARDADAVVVLGGDGVVHLAAQELAGGDVPLGVLPAGTGNDVADTLGLPADPLAAADAVVAAAAAGRVRRIDLGRTDTGRWWVTVLCAGFDSAVTERANRMRWPRGPRRYDVAIAAELLRLAPRPFRIDVDDSALSVPAVMVAVGNGPQYGGGKRITHGAAIDDGRFLVGVVAPLGRLRFARLAPSVTTGAHVGNPVFTTHEATTVRLDAPGTVAYADGERIGPLPVTTTCVPAALPVLVP